MVNLIFGMPLKKSAKQRRSLKKYRYLILKVGVDRYVKEVWSKICRKAPTDKEFLVSL